jgi:hypothetical protein
LYDFSGAPRLLAQFGWEFFKFWAKSPA